jgi:hypothetical protein
MDKRRTKRSDRSYRCSSFSVLCPSLRLLLTHSNLSGSGYSAVVLTALHEIFLFLSGLSLDPSSHLHRVVSRMSWVLEPRGRFHELYPFYIVGQSFYRARRFKRNETLSAFGRSACALCFVDCEHDSQGRFDNLSVTASSGRLYAKSRSVVCWLSSVRVTCPGRGGPSSNRQQNPFVQFFSMGRVHA